jgi:kynurenine formamidase
MSSFETEGPLSPRGPVPYTVKPDNAPLRHRKSPLTMQDVHAMALKCRNWGKWGPNDEIGTLNYATPELVAEAAKLIRNGKAFPLAIELSSDGPQSGARGRMNPVHLMRHSGADAYSGLRDHSGIRGADDWLIMPLQAATHWDALSHIFYIDRMWNGYECREVYAWGAQKCGIEKTRGKASGRGVLLDIPRVKGVEALADGTPITPDDLDQAAAKQNVKVGRGDFLIVRTGQMEAYQKRGSWGTYAGGDAPGLSFETAEWLNKKEVAAVATDTWGCEVRPNDAPGIFQPWHWVVIPNMGLTMGEMFDLKDLAEDCAADKRYDFFFVAPSLPVRGAVGAPVVPMAFK